MDKTLRKEIHKQVCEGCGSWLHFLQDEGLFIACNKCGLQVCKTCYEFICKMGNQSCPKCHIFYNIHTGVPSVTGGEPQCTADSWESTSRDILNSNSLECTTSKKELYALDCRSPDNVISYYPKDISIPVNVPGSTTIEKVCTEPPNNSRKWTIPYPYLRTWGWKEGHFIQFVQHCPVSSRHIFPSQASGLMSSETPPWKERLQQWKSGNQNISCTTVNQSLHELDDCSTTESEWDHLEKDEELRQPLSRKVPIPSSKINPYRVVVLFRLVALAFFLRYRIVTPVQNAYGLWLTSTLCEAWFALSWMLDQLPKWQPISRETYPDRLYLRYNEPGDQCQLPCIDVFINTVDPLKEPALVTSNTVLSVLAVEYPTKKITCYVSDDGASLLTLETLSETCQFARKWVPFCRKFNIEPRSPESYFSQKVDYLKHNTFPTFAKERRMMKRQYEEFKVQINGFVAKFRDIPCDGWVMRDGTPWPGNNTRNHPGMLQILSGRNGPRDCEGKELPQLVYVSREKSPCYQHNKRAGAMNSLIRVSAILTNGSYVLNLNCNQYINNSKALLEAMCFVMDCNITSKACYVQFPQRFDGIDASDRYASHNTVFYDIHLKALDGIQGPFYVGTGCFFNRKALYGYYPSRKKKMTDRCDPSGKKEMKDGHHYAITHHLKGTKILSDTEISNLEREDPSLFLSLKKYYGESLTLIASIVARDDGFPTSITHEELLKEAIHVISCDYEDNTSWGREIGFIYGSLASDILTGLKMHARGWRSIYCTPSHSAFRGTATLNLSDRLNQVLQWALGSVEILFSRHCPIWYPYCNRLKWLQRIAYINTTIYPLTSVPLVIYCTLPAICLISDKFIFPQISTVGSIWLFLFFLSIFATGVLEMRWSGVGTQEWWRNQQFWVIGGLSAHLFAIIYGPIKILFGKKADLTVLTERSLDDEFRESYALRWTALLIMPTTIILVNLCGMLAGITSALNGGYGSRGLLFAKLFFSFLVIIHLHPFLKGLLVRQHRIPTVVVVWSLLLASLFSLLWIRVNPFVTRFTGPESSDCGIYC